MSLINRILLPGALLALISCNLLPNQAIEVVNGFYEYQQDGNVNFPGDMFISMEAASQVKFAVSQREMIYGGYISHKRTGTNWRFSIGENRKKETVTYTCVVTCVNGKTRETLMLERHKDSETFRVTAYVIENISIFNELSPKNTV